MQALTWYRKAAEQGYARAQFALALRYDSGQGVARDVQARRLAAPRRRTGARAGPVQSRAALRQGPGRRAGQRASRSLVPHAPHDQGHASSQFNLALIYDSGHGVPRDEAALDWYRARPSRATPAPRTTSACATSTARAWTATRTGRALVPPGRGAGLPARNITLVNCTTTASGVEHDAAQAVHWYQQAAEQGHLRAQFDLGLRYESGVGVAQDAARALTGTGARPTRNTHRPSTWWACCSTGTKWADPRQAGALVPQGGRPGPRAGPVRARRCATTAPTASRDYEAAHFWYLCAARQGHARAQLGVMYRWRG
jgi:TPR repeat protein